MAAPTAGSGHRHTQDSPVVVDPAKHDVLHPVPLDRCWTRRRDPPGGQPGRGEISVLPQIGADHPDIEVSRLYPAEPPLHALQRGVYRDRLMVARRRTRPDRARVAAILPEERAHSAPVPGRETTGIAAEQMLNGVLVPARAGGGAILDPAPQQQEADPERRDLWGPYADRRWASSCASSSWFCRRVLGVSSAKDHCTMPSGPINT